MRSNLVDGDSRTKLFESLEDGPQAAVITSSSETSELQPLDLLQSTVLCEAVWVDDRLVGFFGPHVS
jgi:hypothetical protein